MSNVKHIVKQHARECGFDLVGVSSAGEFYQDRSIALQRLRAGLMEGLPWYTEARVRRGTNPQELLPGARSIICLGLNYYQPDDGQAGSFEDRAPSHFENQRISPLAKGGSGETPFPGRVARYAWGGDYHQVIKDKMRTYVSGLSALLNIPIAARWYVDDGPMLDRAAAQRAGIGWFGKNTNILTPSHGSWVFLGQVVTDLEMEPDPPLQKSCGNCVRCIESCPTGAIVAPYVIDNARCIAYLTIENRGPIPRELRPLMQDWVFGCDICQDVCPVNLKAQPSNEPAFQRDGRASGAGQVFPAETGDGLGPSVRPSVSLLDLADLLELTEGEFRTRFRRSPILRAKRIGLQRNACVALGNRKDPEAVPALCRALVDGAPLVRGHAAWALGQIGALEGLEALRLALKLEQEPVVQEELRDALAERRTLIG